MKNRIIAALIILLVMITASSAYVYLKKDNGPFYYESGNQQYKVVPAQQRQELNDQISSERKNLITETVKKVSPAVVGISVTEIREYRDPMYSMFDDELFRRFFGDRTYKQQVKNLGSGTIITPDGYILTNDHVAGNGVKITVTTTNGKHLDAKIVGTDPASDICLLKVDGDNLPYIPLGNSNDIIIGEWVIALGNPFGLFEINDQPTVTVGVISAQGMNIPPVNNRYYLGMLQTDASINSGNSGGPLVNSVGELIGMNTLIYTGGGAGSIGLGFAIPVNKIKHIIDELRKKGTVDRNFWVGMRVQTIDEGIANYYKLPSSTGVIIAGIDRNSPASKAGLEVTDIITEVEGYKITNDQTLTAVFQEFRTGQVITIKILRDNNLLTKTMRLEKNP